MYHEPSPKEAIQSKPFLKVWYRGVYVSMANGLPLLPMVKRICEVGSGGHDTIKDVIPCCVTSDIRPGNDMVMSAERIPAGAETLDAILGLNVFHHLEDPATFLDEAARTLRHGGRLILVEPSKTWWAKLIYSLHYEQENQFEAWDWFSDEARAIHPCLIGWRRIKIETFCPFSYILSGGVKRRWSAPMWLYRPVRWLDRVFKSQGIFALYVLERL